MTSIGAETITTPQQIHSGTLEFLRGILNQVSLGL